jgi:hypothetical protein
MLTKEERNAIAERLNKCEGLGDLYYAVIGEELPTVTSYEQDIDAIFTRLSDLCDTSNMVELPIDKDGEVIRVDDNVYDIDGTELAVESLRYCTEYGCVVICRTSNDTLCTYSGNELTHKNPVITKLLAQRIKHVLENEATSIGVNPYVELGRIAEQLESLGDSGEE